jgi:hypothetical protein
VRLIPWLFTVIGAIWSTGNILLALIAFLAFSWQKAHPEVITREGTGAIFGIGLGVWASAVSLLLVPLLVAVGWRCGKAWRGRRPVVAALWLALLAGAWGVHAVNRQTTDEANQLAAGIRELRAKPADQQGPLPALEERFAKLHHASEAWHGGETLIALGLLIGGSWELLRRRAEDRASPAALAT